MIVRRLWILLLLSFCGWVIRKSWFWGTRDIGMCLRCGYFGRSEVANVKLWRLNKSPWTESRIGESQLQHIEKLAHIPEFSKPNRPPKESYQHPNITRAQATKVQNHKFLEVCFVRVRCGTDREHKQTRRQKNTRPRRKLHHLDGNCTIPTE